MGSTERERVLVAVVAETRAWQITAESLIANVVDALGADLALCVGDHEEPNPLHDRAKFVWRVEEPDDWAAAYDRKAGGASWRKLLKPGAQLLGGIEDPEAQEVGSGAIVLYFRQLLAESIDQAGIADDYDWLIVTRSDLLWPVQHPPVESLSARHIHALDGEAYGGVEDRHLIVPRRHVRRFLEVPAPIFSDPESLRRELDRISVAHDWHVLNPERFLAARLRTLGLARRIRYLPYCPYLVRGEGDRSRWTQGSLHEDGGYYVKYPTELERSRIAQRFVSDRDSWIRYLAPIRGARHRRALRVAYRERGLYERPFAAREAPLRAARRVRHLVEGQRRQAARMAVAAGRRLRRSAWAEAVLDARIRRLERRAERRADRT
jgi:hypothetical protein